MIVEGVLTVNEDGSNPQFVITWKNDYVKKAINNNTIFQGSVIILDELDRQGAFD
jgi:hypothetical protein